MIYHIYHIISIDFVLKQLKGDGIRFGTSTRLYYYHEPRTERSSEWRKSRGRYAVAWSLDTCLRSMIFRIKIIRMRMKMNMRMIRIRIRNHHHHHHHHHHHQKNQIDSAYHIPTLCYCFPILGESPPLVSHRAACTTPKPRSSLWIILAGRPGATGNQRFAGGFYWWFTGEL